MEKDRRLIEIGRRLLRYFVGKKIKYIYFLMVPDIFTVQQLNKTLKLGVIYIYVSYYADTRTNKH